MQHHRVLAKGISAEVQITLRPSGYSGVARPIPLEPFTVSKDMGRILLRRGGETIAAGMRLACFHYVCHTLTSCFIGIVSEIFA